MFEEIPLSKIQYSNTLSIDSLDGLHIANTLTTDNSSINEGMIYLKNCSYLLDGISYVCPPYPISDFAKNSLLYIQSFSFWESQKSYYTRRKELDSYLIVFTYSGEGVLEYCGKKYILKDGDIFFIDCNKPHYYKANNTNWIHSDLHFAGNLAAKWFKEFEQNGEIYFNIKTFEHYQNRLESLLKAYISVNPSRDLIISANINALLAFMLTESQEQTASRQTMPEQLTYLIHYINNNYTTDLSLEFLTKFFGFSKYHLCRIFKKYTGYTIVGYITALRINRAKELLKTTSLPANKIGSMVGIADTNYFYRLFKKHTGVSPKDYR